MDASFLFALLVLAVATVSGALGWVSKYVWRDQVKTQFFCILGACATMLFIVYLVFVLE
jgi:hypothetical protein